MHIDFSVVNPAPWPFMSPTWTAYTRRKPVISTFTYGLDIIDQLHRRVSKSKSQTHSHFCCDFQNLWPLKGYHDPSSSGSPGILFTRLLFHTKQQSRKREIIQSNIYRILPKVNQVIYTLDTIYEPNIVTLAQGVLEIFCSQCPLWVKCPSMKRGTIQVKFWQNFMKS